MKSLWQSAAGAVLTLVSLAALGHPGHGAPTTGVIAVLHEMAHALEQSPAVLLALYLSSLAFIGVLALRLARAAVRALKARHHSRAQFDLVQQRSAVKSR
jgi:hypothetical protein